MQQGWIEGRRWQRRPGDLAVRVRLEDLREGLSAGIVVDPSLVVLFSEDGHVREEIGPGNYQLENLLDRLRFWKPGRVVDVILVARGPHALGFTLDDVVTKDDQVVRVAFDVSLEVVRASVLALAMLPAPGLLTLADAAARMRPGIRRAVDAAMGRETLAAGFDRAALTASLQQLAEVALERQGMNVLDLGPLQVGAPFLDALREARAKDAVSAAEADRLQRRLDTLERLRDAVRADRTGELRDQRALERVIDELDHDRLLETRDRQRLAEAFHDEDRAAERLRELLEDEHARAREAATIAHRGRQELEGADATIERQKRAHRAEQELRVEEHQHDVHEALDGIRLLEEMKRAKTRVRLEEEGTRQEREEAARSHSHDRELARLRALDELRPETLVAATEDAERARVLEQMNRARHASQLTPDQLLALVADRSPDAARALQGRVESASDGELKAMYERMLEIQGDASRRAEDLVRELARTAMETQAAVAREASRRVPDVGRSHAAASACPRCGVRVGGGNRFCAQCGATLGG